MTNRLLTSSDDALELALLGSALEELPTGAGLRDTALALGLATATATALAAALPTAASPLANSASLGAGSLGAVSGAVTAAAPPTAVASVATSAGAASLATLGKAVLGGAMVSFALLSGVEHLASPPARTSPAATATPMTPPALSAVSAAPTTRGGSLVAPTEPLAPEAVAPPPSATLRPSLRRSATRGANVAVAPPPLTVSSGQATVHEEAPRRAQGGADASLAEETRVLEQARVALDRGDASGAAARLSEYRSQGPSGVLALEAGLLEVRLLLATGQRAAATERARALISRYPGSAYAQSLRRLVAEQP